MVQDDREAACDICKALEDLYNDGVAEGELKGKVESILDILSEYGVVTDALRDKVSSETNM